MARLTTRADGCSLSVRIVNPPRTCRGTIFVPPLIGGSGMQQVNYFRGLNRAGYAIATFDYRGHGKSGGRFSVRTSVSDALRVTRALSRAGVQRPLFGLGDCYSAIPLLAAVDEMPETFTAVALVNAVPSLQFAVGPRQLLRNYFLPEGRLRARNPLDLKGILAATNSILFPEVDKSRDHFGILDYANARGLVAVWEYFTLDPLAGVTIRVPTLVTYGTGDSILGLDEPGRESAYRDAWRRIAPSCEIRPLPDVDHFFSDTLQPANEVPREFFERVVQESTTLRAVTVTPASAPSGTTSSVA